MPSLAYLNGQFLPLEEAKISVEDRGFQFGDGIYEMIRVYRGVPFRLHDHFLRFERSAQAISIPCPLSGAEWEALILDGIARSQCGDGKVYIQLTRGVAPRDHLFPGSVRPTFVMTFRDLDGMDVPSRRQGVQAVTLPDLRWARCSVKSLNLLPNLLAKQAANEAGAFEAILVKDGLVTEGTTSNVCLVNARVVITPPLSDRLLAGVTRAVVLELAGQCGIAIDERAVREEELSRADELFLIGTTIEVLPVVRLNSAPVGAGMPGTVTQVIGEAFRRCVLSETGRGPASEEAANVFNS